MSKFIRIVGGCSVNNIGFDVYGNKDGSATLRPTKCGNHMPRSKWVKFESLDCLEEKIEKIDLCGANLVQKLKDIYL